MSRSPPCLHKIKSIYTYKARPAIMSQMSLLYWLPDELIIEIAILLDAPSLVRLESVRTVLSFFLSFPYSTVQLILC